jgi:hypothetical protein
VEEVARTLVFPNRGVHIAKVLLEMPHSREGYKPVIGVSDVIALFYNIG